MKAELIALQGKYYGTQIALKYKGAHSNESTIKIWISGENTNPSERQIKKDGYSSLEEWLKESGEYDHMETQSCYELCRDIVEMINKKGESK